MIARKVAGAWQQASAWLLGWVAYVDMSEPVDFIAEYCDRWCERCAFTDRCSAFAVQAAIAMCDGDVEAAIELAVGQPQPDDNSPKPVPPGQRWMDEALAHITEDEVDQARRDEQLRDERIDDTPLKTASIEYSVLAHKWLRDQEQALPAVSAPRSALEIIRWDSALIGAKLHRALSGFNLSQELRNDDPVENDWNGSAKLTLLLLGRTAAAWRVVIHHTDDADAKRLLEAAERLTSLLEAQFPNAMKFRRPGFDA